MNFRKFDVFVLVMEFAASINIHSLVQTYWTPFQVQSIKKQN